MRMTDESRTATFRADRAPRSAPPARRERLPMTAAEFGDAGVLAALAALLVALGRVIPHASALSAGAVVPFLLLGVRHRARVVVAATVAAAVVAALVAGAGAATAVTAAAVGGGVVGVLVARDRGTTAVAAVAALLGGVLGGVLDLALLVLPATRELLLGTVSASAVGALRVLSAVLPLAPTTAAASGLIGGLIGWWAVLLPLGVILAAVVGMCTIRLMAVPLLSRLDLPPIDLLAAAAPGPVVPAGAVPVALRGVHLRHPGWDQDALDGVTLDLLGGEFVVVTGANGSGKSSLLRCLAGAPIAGGEIRRPGGVGLGRPGGTALILQRPETQVLGSTVAEDLRWSLPEATDGQVEAALAEVGLSGFGARSTAGLSGGELQRLALAGALARGPALLLSDESTAMVDPTGRAALVALLASAARDRGMTVVHVTHFQKETAQADRHLTMAAGRIVSDRPPRPAPVVRTMPVRHRPPETGAVLRLQSVGFVYAPSSPWEQRVLEGVDLEVRRGEGVRIVGDNGSGKTTLARVLVGLTRPTTGSCTVNDRPAHRAVGRVGMAFQHPRLQLQRPTVAEDVAAAAGLSIADAESVQAEVTAALGQVGLDPSFGERRIEALSGGQMRRVALAGVLARRPAGLVLDEPFAGLDPTTRDTVIDALVRLRDEAGLAVVLITHDDVGADLLCHRSVVLHDGILR